LEQAIEFIVAALEEEDIREISSLEDVQLLLLVRMDLKMGLGKVAAQCAHATLRAYQLARSRAQSDEHYSLAFIQWLESGQEKVAYQVNSEQQLFDTLKRFEAMGVGTCFIRDAGRTQVLFQ
jgi:peptidyl-tRNA hydrolase, PTH2 family